jgi:hypothetical protein
VESLAIADTGVSWGFTEWTRFPEGNEYVRIINDREQVSRKVPDGRSIKDVMDSVSYLFQQDIEEYSTPGIRNV